MWQIILTAIFYVWLFAVLVLLWRIWRSSSEHTRRLEDTLIDLVTKEAMKHD